MENLPEKVNTQSVALAIYNPTPGTKAIDIRRQMVQLPEVAKSLSGVEKYIFAASTKTQIAEIDDGTLVAKTGQMFRFIALDVGYIIPTNTDDWAYICTRLLDILKKYYSQMTLADIKLAFELATTGELDEYLPKGRDGQPDKAHYQQFNADYFAKILNAYRRKQNGVIHKAYQALPEPKREMSESEKRYHRNNVKRRCRDLFLQYKYCGRLKFGLTDEMFVYDWLVKSGLAEPVQETEDDRKTALSLFLQRAARGFVNEFTVYHVRREGTKSKELDFTAYEVARRKVIIKAFDNMIEDEIFIDNYIEFENEQNND